MAKRPKPKNFDKDDNFQKFANSNKDDSDFNRSGSRSSRKSSKGRNDYRRSSRGRGSNDIGWYTPSDQLLNDAGRWPYSTPVGTPLSRNSLLSIADANERTIPGIISIGLENTIGNCLDGSDTPNVAANAIFTYVRHTNSGARNYDANDTMIYICAMDSIYTCFSWFTRLYGTVNMYAQMNKYLPDNLGFAQDVDLQSIRSNMANFRMDFNSRVMKVASLVVPDTMAIFRRHAFMYQNYYSEGLSIKDQLYMYYPKGIYVFKLDSNGAGMLEHRAISDYFNANNLLDAAGMMRMLDDMITPIFNDEDFNIMGGDMLKAYGNNIFRLAQLPDDYICVPVNNYEVLCQFKNMRIWNMSIPTSSSDLDIVQDSNKEFLISTISDPSLFIDLSGVNTYDSQQGAAPDVFKVAYDELSRSLILTTESQDVTPAENMTNTRLTVSTQIELDSSKPSGLAASELSYGTEIPVTARTWWIDASTKQLRSFNFASIVTFDTRFLSVMLTTMQEASILSAFRFHPNVVIIGYDQSTSPTTYSVGTYLFSIDNFTVIDYDHVKSLHDVAILGEFNVPKLAVVG